MAILTNGTDTITPDLIDGYESTSEARNVVHPILGSEDVDVVLRPATLPTGTMVLVMGNEASAAAAEDALRGAHVWSLVTDRGTVDMSFIVAERITRTLDRDTRDVWLVSFGWQEVDA
ncbi:hypothetical protein [Agromyces larvae]|uniref:Uncharacterized protein n=1 Tax=Agromyces larvae TaxID=2929802 RepID=A0ABY4BX41_9MICO|nr:hypothetical protein [Agromyces larvae]UOE43747.1 hypothetical protein MTO99_16485 [Agromyces larvae]